MSFSAITARLEDLLISRKTDLVAGLRDHNLAIEASYVRPHFSPQVLFIYRDGLRDIDHGSITSPGAGATAAGEMEGRGDWILAPCLRFTGAEDVAAQELDKLTWNLLSVMAGYTADLTNAYMSCLFAGSTTDFQAWGSDSGYYVVERLRYSVSWDLTF